MDVTLAEDKKFLKELSAGTSALVLLGVVGRAREPMYGYQIAKLIDAGRDDVPMMKQGALYPVLRSLEKTGLLESTVEPSVTGPPRRYYRITEKGRSALDRWTELWNGTKSVVDSSLKGKRHDQSDR
ncbi:MAG: PadR family transcriptional regulator [Candidatus Krumholzibacteriaceae bacterium]